MQTCHSPSPSHRTCIFCHTWMLLLHVGNAMDNERLAWPRPFVAECRARGVYIAQSPFVEIETLILTFLSSIHPFRLWTVVDAHLPVFTTLSQLSPCTRGYNIGIRGQILFGHLSVDMHSSSITLFVSPPSTSSRPPPTSQPGRRCNPTGFLTRKGRFKLDPYRLVQFVVPDTTDFPVSNSTVRLVHRFGVCVCVCVCVCVYECECSHECK